MVKKSEISEKNKMLKCGEKSKKWGNCQKAVK